MSLVAINFIRSLAVQAPQNVTVSEIDSQSAVIEFASQDFETVSMYEIRYYPVGTSEIKSKQLRPGTDKRVVLAGK